MKHWKTWLLCLALIFGMATELFKSVSQKNYAASPHLTDLSELSTEFGYHVQDAAEPAVAPHSVHPPTTGPQPSTLQKPHWTKKFSHRVAKVHFKHGRQKKGPKKVKKTNKQKKKKKKKKKIAKKAKKKKKDKDKKKKKKIPTADTENTVASDERPQPQSPDPEAESNPFLATPLPTLVPPPQPLAANNPVDEEGVVNVKTLDEWLDLLLQRPSVKETDRFINFFRLKQVSTSIFFEVTDQMLEDRRERIRFLAVRALGNVQRLESFTTLAEISLSDNFSPRTQRSSNDYLRLYQNLEHIDILSQVLSSDVDDDIKLLAMTQVESAARRHITPPTTTPTTTPQEPSALDTNRILTRTRVQTFEQMASTLRLLSTSSEDAEVRRRANDLQGHLINALNSSGLSQLGEEPETPLALNP